MKIEFDAKILPYDTPAQNGDVIPKVILENMLKSKECQDRLRKGLITGGVTHKSRSTDVKGIPDADHILVDGNFFFKAIDLWMEGKFLMARFVLLDRELSGEVGIMYNNLKTMLLNNIKPPVSSCIRAFWKGSVCREIVFLRGVDVTLQPGFVGSEITTIYLDGEAIK